MDRTWGSAREQINAIYTLIALAANGGGFCPGVRERPGPNPL